MRGRGFTLIELLVVITIIGILMGILIPALAGARLTARSTVGIANLRSISQMLFIYEQEQRACPMPFDPTVEPSQRRVPSSQWYEALHPTEDRPIWDFSSIDPRVTTELFGIYWYSWLADWTGGSRDAEVQFSPADRLVLDQLNQLRATPASLNGDMLWPSSFYLSATLWSTPGRFGAGSRGPMTRETLMPTTFASMAFPEAKVLIYERADFAQKTRVSFDSAGARRENMPPSWANPRARPHVATGDGSVRQLDMGELHDGAAEDAQFLPGGRVSPADLMPLYASRVPDRSRELSGGGLGSDGDYPLFFWATNGGIRGRDFSQ